MNKDLLLVERLSEMTRTMAELARLIKEMGVKPRPLVAEGWVDAADVMGALQISKRTLQTLRDNGTLPYSTVGHKTYYRVDDVQRLLMDNYVMFELHDKEKRKAVGKEG